jgi:hypothetical protein
MGSESQSRARPGSPALSAESDFDTFRYECFAGVGAKPMERDRDVAALDQLDIDTKVVGGVQPPVATRKISADSSSAKGDEGFKRIQGASFSVGSTSSMDPAGRRST